MSIVQFKYVCTLCKYQNESVYAHKCLKCTKYNGIYTKSNFNQLTFWSNISIKHNYFCFLFFSTYFYYTISLHNHTISISEQYFTLLLNITQHYSTLFNITKHSSAFLDIYILHTYIVSISQFMFFNETLD